MRDEQRQDQLMWSVEENTTAGSRREGKLSLLVRWTIYIPYYGSMLLL